MPFTFKQFHIDDNDCGMPVSTDGVLLGAWAALAQASTVLDIGAGSGLLSLMAAQRSQAQITAIELETSALKACQKNVAASPWADRISVLQGAIQQFTPPTVGFEHIVCNPPYFLQGLKSQQSARAMARHTQSLSFAELLAAIRLCLQPAGRASLILPQVSLTPLLALLPEYGLSLHQCVDVASVAGKPAQRHLISLCHTPSTPVKTRREQLHVREKNGEYSDRMRQLTQDFYLKL